MTAAVSLLPPQTGSMLPPAAPVEGLTDEEQHLVTGLALKLVSQTPLVLERWAYYDGQQRLKNLGMSIPPQLAGVRTVVDWPRICVDPLVQRCVVDGFRIPNATDVDTELAAHWDANDLDAEAPLAFLDAMVAGRGYMIVGSPDEPGGSPVVTVESPLNMSVLWDPRTRRITAAYQSFQVEGIYQAALYVPGRSIFMARDSQTSWQVYGRDEHGFDEVPVVRLVNRARSSDREGRSEISQPMMNTTDAAVRALLGMDIAREVYAIPHLYVLGASESDFVDRGGNPKTSLDMAMTKIMALERDAEGNLPQVGQFTAFDPSVFTKIVDEHAQLMSSYTGFPPSYFGQATTANPASADAIRTALNGLDRRAGQVQQQFSGSLRKAAQLIWRFANDGAALPKEMQRLGVDWVDSATPTPAATTDAIVKQVAAGIIPATSDVTLKQLRYSDVERARLAQDRDQAAQLESELTSSLAARQARAGSAIANDLEAAAAAAAGPMAPPNVP